MTEMRHFYPDEKRIELLGTSMDCLDGSDALLICTEWQEFRSPDYEVIKNALKSNLVIDGRNLYDPKVIEAAGLTYDCIGRPGDVKAA